MSKFVYNRFRLFVVDLYFAYLFLLKFSTKILHEPEVSQTIDSFRPSLALNSHVSTLITFLLECLDKQKELETERNRSKKTEALFA